uniref:NADH dehydrogenase subunit 3 n=1 Tax=Pallenopsis patagonica TaxID=648475 RepID=UPI00226D2160|nr:NADH dehydrogenase subunit 3 [Pallenopsis patagonica]UZA61344.1 NADH dehydrogenase subunit 3 [Pallenopsis patagonica]
MNAITNLMLIITFIIMLLLSISYSMMKKNLMELEKSSPIECGMNPINSPRTPFSIQFFLIAILFMIFDVEIALIIPLPLLKMFNMKMFLLTIFTFLLILLLGIIYEWHNGALE